MKNKIIGALLLVAFAGIVFMFLARHPDYVQKTLEHSGIAFTPEKENQAHRESVKFSLFFIPFLLWGLFYLMGRDHPMWRWQSKRNRSSVTAYVSYYFALNYLSMYLDGYKHPEVAVGVSIVLFPLAIVLYVGAKKKVAST